VRRPRDNALHTIPHSNMHHVVFLQAANGKVHVERIRRDGGALCSEEARALVERDAPELLALLEELKDSLHELRARVGPVLSQVRNCPQYKSATQSNSPRYMLPV